MFFFNTAAEFKEVSPWQTNNKTTIKDLICGGLSASNNSDTPCFVTFFAPKKFDTAEKKNKSQMKFHMAVFTVRSLGGVKDGNGRFLYLFEMHLFRFGLI